MYMYRVQECLEDAERIVASEKITAVLSRSDADALVCAALTQKFPDLLRGPSVEAIFLANNKYHTRCVLDPDPITLCPDTSLLCRVRSGRAAASVLPCHEAVRNVGVPAFFKPCSSYGSAGIASIHSGDHLFDVAKSYIDSDLFSKFDVDTKFLNPFYVRNLDLKKWPLAITEFQCCR